jgi:glycosyltransferase involved in cell wall biosynthesis
MSPARRRRDGRCGDPRRRERPRAPFTAPGTFNRSRPDLSRRHKARACPYNRGVAELDYSLVVPVYNEREMVRELVARSLPAMERLGPAFEVVIVDDGSTDGSSELLDELAATEPRLVVLHFERNCGQSAAFDAGFRHARGRIVITIDADLQSDPADIGLLLPHLDRFDAAVGIRRERHDTGWRKFSSRFANSVRNWLTREDIVDTGCPLKAFRAEAIKSVCMWKGSHRFLPTLLRMKGYTVTQVPVPHHARHAGASKYGTLDRAFRGLRDALGVRWMQDRNLDWKLRAGSTGTGERAPGTGHSELYPDGSRRA